MDPGRHPGENLRFLTFLIAVIAAVDKYADLLRVSVATAGNDHRLGANEAPPAIVSIFLGEDLTRVLDAMEKGEFFDGIGKRQMETGAAVLPHFMRDTTDRNRTSPFAFTGNKFEFRMPGSALSVANPNIVLNTAVADILSDMYDELKGVPQEELSDALKELLRKMLTEHRKVLFNGNGYTDEWVKEAESRGLDNLKSLPEAMPRWISEKSIKLFTKHQILTKEELLSRYEIVLENYSKAIHIESLTLQEMVRKDFADGMIAYVKDLAEVLGARRTILPSLACAAEEKLLTELDADAAKISEGLEKLAADTKKAEAAEDELERAAIYEAQVLSDMVGLREYIDHAETLIPDRYLPYPTYGKILFSTL